MIKSETKLRAWGNSIGVVLPKDALKEENLEVNDEVEIIVKKKSNLLKEAFGKLKNAKAKSNKSNEKLLKDINKELESRFG